ncbi:hypothetical protein C8R44DRAFT_877803 [Mycena epipterygia]|nr:hypothetical protein C8R44DRAFT_877803 [Mycena epipterygia]
MFVARQRRRPGMVVARQRKNGVGRQQIFWADKGGMEAGRPTEKGVVTSGLGYNPTKATYGWGGSPTKATSGHNYSPTKTMYGYGSMPTKTIAAWDGREAGSCVTPAVGRMNENAAATVTLAYHEGATCRLGFYGCIMPSLGGIYGWLAARNDKWSIYIY